MNRRSVLVAAALTLPGCSTLAWSETATPPPDDEPVVAGSGDFPHEIRVVNARERAASVTVSVERANAIIYEATHQVRAETTETVAGFTRTRFAPEHRYVTVEATTPGGGSASVGVSVTECLGDVVIRIAGGGSVDMSYSIC